MACALPCRAVSAGTGGVDDVPQNRDFHTGAWPTPGSRDRGRAPKPDVRLFLVQHPGTRSNASSAFTYSSMARFVATTKSSMYIFLADHARHETAGNCARARAIGIAAIVSRVEGQVPEQDDVRPRAHANSIDSEERPRASAAGSARGLPLVREVQFQPVLIRAAVEALERAHVALADSAYVR